MVKGLRDLRRHEAKMIAEELFALMRNDIKKVTTAIAEAGQEEYLNLKDTAAFLSMSKSTLYKKKDDIGCYTKVGRQIRFSKSALIQSINEGRLRLPV